MANRRMFSKEIVGSDDFLDLPVSSRELYFQLGMYADDDGFVTPKKVIRMVGSSDDDLKVLIAKKFVLPFQSGVIVIKHWKDNNFIRKDTYQPTIYRNELTLALDDEIYSADRHVDDALTSRQRSIGKYSIDKVTGKNLTFKGQPVNINYGKYQVYSQGAWRDLDPKYIKEVKEQ